MKKKSQLCNERYQHGLRFTRREKYAILGTLYGKANGCLWQKRLCRAKKKKKVKRWSGKVSDCIGNRIDGWKIKLTPETAQAIQQSEQVTN